MGQNGETLMAARSVSAEAVLALLPVPEYGSNYQPSYLDVGQVLEAIHELQSTEAVTTPRQVDDLQNRLADIAVLSSRSPVVITRNCHEEVKLETHVSELVGEAVRDIALVASAVKNVTHIQRNRGQNAKPRSNNFQILSNGLTVVSHMGDAINGADVAHRIPDPTRMVAAAVQARDLEAGLKQAVGYHVPAAHEALLLPYEESFISIDPETGRQYLLSADLPWIGKRTNNADGDHVALLSKVENPLGIKIGADSTAEHITALVERLNPDQKPGKIVFMLRIGNNPEATQTILRAINTHAPESVIIYDIHGTTRILPDGTKVRLVPDIIDEVRNLAKMCNAEGLKLHGVHLETMSDDSRLECVDELGQLPTHPGGIDPQLNPRQTRKVLTEVTPYLL